MLWFDLRMVHLLSNVLRGDHGFLCLLGVFVDIHRRVHGPAHAAELFPPANRAKRFVMRALLRRELSRQLRFHGGVQIAVFSGLSDQRHAVSLQPKHLPILRARRNLQAQRFAAEIRYFRFAAEHRRRHGHANFRMEILPLALEPRIRRQVHAQIEIARVTRRRILAHLRLTRARAIPHRRLAEFVRRPFESGRRA